MLLPKKSAVILRKIDDSRYSNESFCDIQLTANFDAVCGIQVIPNRKHVIASCGQRPCEAIYSRCNVNFFHRHFLYGLLRCFAPRNDDGRAIADKGNVIASRGQSPCEAIHSSLQGKFFCGYFLYGLLRRIAPRNDDGRVIPNLFRNL